jgi:hypothetical protein
VDSEDLEGADDGRHPRVHALAEHGDQIWHGGKGRTETRYEAEDVGALEPGTSRLFVSVTATPSHPKSPVALEKQSRAERPPKEAGSRSERVRQRGMTSKTW